MKREKEKKGMRDHKQKEEGVLVALVMVSAFLVYFSAFLVYFSAFAPP